MKIGTAILLFFLVGFVILALLIFLTVVFTMNYGTFGLIVGLSLIAGYLYKMYKMVAH